MTFTKNMFNVHGHRVPFAVTRVVVVEGVVVVVTVLVTLVVEMVDVLISLLVTRVGHLRVAKSKV